LRVVERPSKDQQIEARVAKPDESRNGLASQSELIIMFGPLPIVVVQRRYAPERSWGPGPEVKISLTLRNSWLSPILFT
jgi:hypothetical protein